MEAIILFDTPMSNPKRKGQWSHLVASDIDSLHAFAEKIGLKKSWFQNKKKKNKRQPHYDIKSSMLDKAIEQGAVLVPRKELFNFLLIHYP